MSNGFKIENIPANHGNHPSINPLGSTNPSTTIAGPIDQLITTMDQLGKTKKFTNYTDPNGGLMGMILYSEPILQEELKKYISDPASFTGKKDLGKRLNLCRVHIPEITGTFPDFDYKSYLSLKQLRGSKKPKEIAKYASIIPLQKKIKRYPIAFTLESNAQNLEGQYCRVYFKDKNNLSIGIISEIFQRTVSQP